VDEVSEVDPVALMAVNVGTPTLLGMHRGRPVHSGIAKRPVPAGVDELWLGRTNLEGDGQADLEVHGGVDKAVYAYPSEHLPAWRAVLDEEDLGPAPFGENLSTAGWLEGDVRIGDRWRWGDAVLEVCQPRWPCYKLAIHRGRGDIGGLLKEAGRTGWYLRVLVEGRVPVAGPIEVAERHPAGATVLAMHEAARPGHVPAEVVEELLGVEPLAAQWRRLLASRL
jgi:MOSC domain-containing protein YiiM